MHYACIIGVNHEWPEQRKELGDIGLARCLRGHCQLPKERLLEIYDERATRSRVLYSLQEMLNVRNQNITDEDVLLLYYGGHGKREEACTFTKSIVDGKVQKEPWLRYDEIINLLETHFQGGVVWVILDCCHSGGFGEAIMQRYYDSNKTLNVNYGCIMSVPPGDIAGMEWTMSECFIRAFQGELLCSENVSVPYYLSTKKGKHRSTIPEEVILQNGDDALKNSQVVHPTWEQVIDFLADEMARIKGDQLSTLFIGDNMQTSLEKPCRFGDACIATKDSDTMRAQCCNKVGISRDDSWMGQFTHIEYSINDEVYVKWIGKVFHNTSDDSIPAHVIGWLPARIISFDDDTPRFNIYDVVTETSWTSEISINSAKNIVMFGLPFGFHTEPQNCVTSITHFAKQLCYLATSLHPFTPLQIRWTDGEFYPARVMSRVEINWDQIKEHEVDGKYNVIGPYVAVQWEEEDATSLVPLGKCVVTNQFQKNLDEKGLISAQQSHELTVKKVAKSIKTPIDAMMTSLACSGKQLHPKTMPVLATTDMGDQNSNEWESYDAEDKEFLPVQVMNEHVSSLPLEVLAYHVLYPHSGNFSVVFWEEDSVLSLVPSPYLRLRSTNDDSSSESSDSSSYEEECSELNDNDTNRAFEYEDVQGWLETNQKAVQLVTVCMSFAIGYMFGRRTKTN